MPESAWKRPESVLVLIYTRAGEVLLLERRQPAGYWQSVTGSLEWGESPEAAAARELMEETGINDIAVRDCQLRHTFEIHPAWKHRYHPANCINLERVFAARIDLRCRIELDSREHVAFHWLPWRLAVQCATSWTDRIAIQRVVAESLAVSEGSAAQS